MAKSARQALGARGEDLAVAELRRQGMEVLARNWRCRLGEIDVIASEVVGGRRTVVFCEVKCRSGLGFGDPLEAITWAKLRRSSGSRSGKSESAPDPRPTGRTRGLTWGVAARGRHLAALAQAATGIGELHAYLVLAGG